MKTIPAKSVQPKGRIRAPASAAANATTMAVLPRELSHHLLHNIASLK
jgi:hypothetical protein